MMLWFISYMSNHIHVFTKTFHDKGAHTNWGFSFKYFTQEKLIAIS